MRAKKTPLRRLARNGRLQRGTATLRFELAYGRPDLAPQTKVRMLGTKALISSTVWLLSRVTHKLDDGGLTTSCEEKRQTRERPKMIR